MRYIVAIAFSLLLAGCNLNRDGIPSTRDVVKESKNGVVLIENVVDKDKGGIGTGFIIGDNEIVTNNHVIDGNGKLTVYSANSMRKYEAVVKYTDAVADIAVVTLKDWDSFKKNEHPVSLKLGNSDETKQGDSVIVMGHPWGLTWSVSEGIISAKARRIGQNPRFVDQSDAHIYQGNSGGPMFDQWGKVICINDMMYSREGGSYGFCIPSNLVKKVLYDFDKFHEIRWRAINVGVGLTDDGSSVIFKTVEPDGAAAKAGIKEGDKVLKIFTPMNHPNGVEIHTPDDMITEIAVLRGDDELVKLLIERNGEQKMIDVKTNYKQSSDYTPDQAK